MYSCVWLSCIWGKRPGLRLCLVAATSVHCYLSPMYAAQTWRHITRRPSSVFLGFTSNVEWSPELKVSGETFFPSQLLYSLKNSFSDFEQLFCRHLFTKALWLGQHYTRVSVPIAPWVGPKALPSVVTQPLNSELKVTEIGKSPKGNYSFRVSSSPGFPVSPSRW